MVLLAPVNDVEFVQKKLLNKIKYEKSLKIAKEMIQDGKGQNAVPKWMQFYPLLSANTYIQLTDPNSASGKILDYSGELIELKNIKVPILAIFGSEDDYQFEPEKKLDLLKNNINCDTSLIKNSNHWFNSYEDELAEKIINWITKNIEGFGTFKLFK
jgi:pimeloyl-ACP methyl ester carboxylesterase